MRLLLLTILVGAMATPAMAGAFDSIDDRASRVEARVQGKHDYQAELARDMASAAQDELAQHDLRAARQFMDLAEQAASRSGGKQ